MASDVYIDAVLERGAAQLAIRFCNQLFNNSVFTPFFRVGMSLARFCASCKRNSVLRSIPPEALIVYIGDGYSDFCAADHADIIFAKRHLAAYCNRNRLPHYPFLPCRCTDDFAQPFERRRLNIVIKLPAPQRSV